jgi:hypothetical protein
MCDSLLKGFFLVKCSKEVDIKEVSFETLAMQHQHRVGKGKTPENNDF